MAIMNKAAMNIYVQVFVWSYVFRSLWSGIVGSYVVLFNLWGIARLFPKVTVPLILFPLAECKGPGSSISSPVLVSLLVYKYPSGCEVVPHCGGVLYFKKQGILT